MNATLRDALERALDLLADGGDSPDAVRRVLEIATEQLGYDRASLIASVETSQLAYVLSATDDPTLSEFCLEVGSYPELSAALRAGRPLFVADTATDPITASVRDRLEAAQVASVAVFPIHYRQRGFGAVLLRRRVPAGPADADQVAFGRAIAALLGPHLRDNQVIERLREETRKISRASYEAERRLRTIESLKEHFEASADGVFVIDEEGRLLFANGAAVSITGFARERLVGSPLGDYVTAEQRAPLAEVVAGVLGGTNLEAFDLDLYTTSGSSIIVSVATSTVLARSGAAILSFRDVTAERVLDGELQQTKDFLEKLIDSAVDAIIAADLEGNVIVFNTGAERLTGYPAADVLAGMRIEEFYPEGVASQVMRMLRSSQYGGVGRLEQTRRELRTRAGELVPVHMTASIIYDQGQEVATVGIFSDLRERIRIEQRLLDAQERLEAREREAMVAQLAGAAAHELNQPLTSILGYVELIARAADGDAPHRRALEVIRSEATRMAEIVKQIGRITRYEVKEYVGSASIMDLERSAGISAQPPPEPVAREATPVPILDEVEDEPTSRIQLGELLARGGAPRTATEGALRAAADAAPAPSAPDASAAPEADRAPTDGAIPQEAPDERDTRVERSPGRARKS